MNLEPIYLDNNATTFCAEEVVEAMARSARLPFANPASQHRFGRDARKCIEQASDVILNAVNARRYGMQADRLLYCSGGTEANNLAILGLPEKVSGSILVSAIEHPSILAAAELARQRGRLVEYVPCLPSGIIDLDWLRQRLQLEAAAAPVALVAVMAANNETGIIQPTEAIGDLCQQAAVRFHVDAVQCLGKRPVDFQRYRANSMTICAHKLHGPVGVGALIHRAECTFDPLIVGGMQQAAIRSGTESVMLPVGFAHAIARVVGNDARTDRIKQLRDQFERALADACRAERIAMHVIGASVERLVNTACIAFPPHSRQALQMAFDLVGIACSTGSACESGSATPSHVLVAMGLPADLVHSALRFSFSEFNTEAQVDQAISRIMKCLKRVAKL